MIDTTAVDKPRPLHAILEKIGVNNEALHAQVISLEALVGRATGESFPSDQQPSETATPPGVLGEINLTLERTVELINQLTVVTRALEQVA